MYILYILDVDSSHAPKMREDAQYPIDKQVDI